jgi:hypothetical protein
MKFLKQSVIAAFVLAVLFVCAGECFAQGCPMCKTAAAAQSDRATKSLNRAIVFLLVPPVSIMGGILIFAFRCRNVPRQTDASTSERKTDVSSHAA